MADIACSEPRELLVDHGGVELGEHRGRLVDRRADLDRAALPARGAGVVAGDDRVAGTPVEVLGLAQLGHRLDLAAAAEDGVDRVGGERQERRQDPVQVARRTGRSRAGSCRAARARRRP